MEGIFLWSVKVLYILIFTNTLGLAEIVNFGFCVNYECSEPVALGKTISTYNRPDEDKLSFIAGQEVKIYSVKAGPKEDLYGVEINGRRGYVPKIHVQETNNYVKTKKLVKAKQKFTDNQDHLERINKLPDATFGSSSYENSNSWVVSQPSSDFPNSMTSNEMNHEFDFSSFEDTNTPHVEEVKQYHVLSKLPLLKDFSAGSVFTPSQVNSDAALSALNTASQDDFISESTNSGASPSVSSHFQPTPEEYSAGLHNAHILNSNIDNVHTTGASDIIRPNPFISSDLSNAHQSSYDGTQLGHTHTPDLSQMRPVDNPDAINIKSSLTPNLGNAFPSVSHSTQIGSSDSSIIDTQPSLDLVINGLSEHYETSSNDQFHLVESEKFQTLVLSHLHSPDMSNSLPADNFQSFDLGYAHSENLLSIPLIVAGRSSDFVDSHSTNLIDSVNSIESTSSNPLNQQKYADVPSTSQSEQISDTSPMLQKEQKNIPASNLKEVIKETIDAVGESFPISQSQESDVKDLSSSSASPVPTPTMDDDMQETRDILKILNQPDVLADEENTESLVSSEQQLPKIYLDEKNVSPHYKDYDHKRFNYVNEKLSHYNMNKGAETSLNKPSSSESSYDSETEKNSIDSKISSTHDLGEIGDTKREVQFKEEFNSSEKAVECSDGNCERKMNDIHIAEPHVSRIDPSSLSSSQQRGKVNDPQEKASIPSVTPNDDDLIVTSQISKFESATNDSSDNIYFEANEIDNFEHISSNDPSGNSDNDNSVYTAELNDQITSQYEDSLEDPYPSVTTESHFASRDLKSENHLHEKEESYSEEEEIVETSSAFNVSLVLEVFNNSIIAVRSFIETIIIWLPEPIQSYLTDLDTKGISPRVTVFTALSIVPSIFLFIAIFYIKECSNEKKLIVKLSDAEQKLFSTSTERDILKEEVEKCKNLVVVCQNDLEEKQKSVQIMNSELEQANYVYKNTNSELGTHIGDLKQQVKRHLTLISKLERELEESKSENQILQKKLQEEENDVSRITVQLQEFEEEARSLNKEKEDLLESDARYKEKVAQLEVDCNQLLEEAVVWNTRVSELTEQLQSETAYREELEVSVQAKDVEIESLKNLSKSLQVIQDLKDSDAFSDESIKEKMKELLDTSSVQLKLSKVEEERDLLLHKLNGEKAKVLELEVEVLESKSEAEKLKINYNQSLQDKTEAQTKLEVLSHYFKDKELQLQKELGVQEACRQQKEEDASFATRQVHLIEEENTSYKYQVATLKQEIEETERNYKNQVAAQEKKAHKNWIAARAAERKLEELKQESAQLRQRLTLLEREQENWTSSRDEIVRPVPKRLGGPNGEISTSNIQDISRTKDMPPLPHDMMPPPPPLPPMMLPLDRPLPPMMPPPHHLEARHMRQMPPFMHPGDPHLPPPPFRPQPWHLPHGHADSLHSFERRTPPGFEPRQLSTPPRRHESPSGFEHESGKHSASPQGENSRDSRSSSPPHPLPLFHDIPPPPLASRPLPLTPPPLRHYDFPPHPMASRFPIVPPPRRDFMNLGHMPLRTDSRNSDMLTSTPRGPQLSSSAAQDRKQQQQHPSSRV